MLTYEILNPLEELHEHLPRFRLSQLLFHDDPVEEFAFWCKFEYEIHTIRFVEGILKAK